MGLEDSGCILELGATILMCVWSTKHGPTRSPIGIIFDEPILFVVWLRSRFNSQLESHKFMLGLVRILCGLARYFVGVLFAERSDVARWRPSIACRPPSAFCDAAFNGRCPPHTAFRAYCPPLFIMFGIGCLRLRLPWR